MAVQTASQRVDNVAGAVREVQAKFASVATGDTYVTGLAVITGLSVTAGSGKVMTVSPSGGTVTFTVTAGPDTNTFLEAIGY